VRVLEEIQTWPREKTGRLSARLSSWVREFYANEHFGADASAYRVVDVLLLLFLFTLTLLYQLQPNSGWLSELRIREVLYAYLYVRLFVAYKAHRTAVSGGLITWIFAFLVCSALIAGHTYLLYGAEVAALSFLRFVNAALMAPLVGVIVFNWTQIRFFCAVWIGVALLGAITALYQFFGGELDWLVRDYVAFRGGLARFKTLLGEPNVGGMAAAVTCVFAVLTIESRFLKVFALLLSFILLILSISKAGLAILMLGAALVAVFNRRLFTGTRIFRLLALFLALILVANLLIAGSSVVFGERIGNVTRAPFMPESEEVNSYGKVILDVISGRDFEDRGISASVYDRLIRRTVEGIEIAKSESAFYPLNVVVGSSYGIVGSVAVQLRGPEGAILPHNNLSEIYLAGGLISLAVLLKMLWLSFRSLWSMRHADGLRQALLTVYLMLVALLFIYPITYQPVMGALLWLIVGVTANRELNHEGRRVDVPTED
jgi:hypothetical protein